MAIALYISMNANSNKKPNIKENKMKKLSAEDLALLKARGKVTSLTTVTEFTIPSVEKKTKKVKKATKATNPNKNHELVGRMLHTSWGYDMTINNFCVILEVSPTGKTAKCRMLPKEGFNGFQGNVKAGKDAYGPEFRVKIKKWNDGGYHFNGSYPFIVNGDKKEDCSYKMGYWGLHNGGEVFENHMD